jgi:hypothetical protein
MRLLNEWMLFLCLFRISLCKVGILLEPAEVASPSTGEQSVHFPCFGGLHYIVSLAQRMLACSSNTCVYTLYLVDSK